jgi:predicted lipoprotein with Yx(FWY)xxD motif
MSHAIKSFPAFMLLIALAIVVAACGTGGATLVATPATGSGGPVSIGTTTTAQFGTILIGANGMALYTKAGDSATTSNRSGSRLTAWPPLAVSPGQQAVAGPGVNGTFGTLARPDGTLQATYNGRPLYYCQADKVSGDVTGNGIDGFSVAKP